MNQINQKRIEMEPGAETETDNVNPIKKTYFSEFKNSCTSYSNVIIWLYRCQSISNKEDIFTSTYIIIYYT